jgi:5,10-methylene-tetrahydrofolate dehydrogenase/methenyl tetrahydrofolate cyclohydrolase
VVELIEQLNRDASVHGILVQLPLPKHMNETAVLGVSSEHTVVYALLARHQNHRDAVLYVHASRYAYACAACTHASVHLFTATRCSDGIATASNVCVFVYARTAKVVT